MEPVGEYEEISSEFIRNTCRLCPQFTVTSGQNLFLSLAADMALTTVGLDNACHNVFSGSSTEFYIEPMVPFVGDIDVMTFFYGRLAKPSEQPPPRQLPWEYPESVKLFDIVDCVEFPGYVAVKFVGNLQKRSRDNGQYEFSAKIASDLSELALFPHAFFPVNQLFSMRKQDIHRLLPVSKLRPSESQFQNLLLESLEASADLGLGATHGPAQQIDPVRAGRSVDFVPAIRCLQWPTQAVDWSSRQRPNGWPDLPTVSSVVTNGCDVVNVSHRHCKRAPWLYHDYQWRLSFSGAETTLLNTWTPDQQMVYHMLRYMASKEQYWAAAEEDRTMSNYHLKTLMMWACELKPHSWWTSKSLVRVCTQLWHIAADWIEARTCRHYFVARCNLFDVITEDFRDKAGVTAAVLRSYTTADVARWMVENYITEAARQCPGGIFRLFDGIGGMNEVELRRAVSSLVRYLHSTAALDFVNRTSNVLSGLRFHVRLMPTWKVWNLAKIQLRNVDRHFEDYLTAAVFQFITEALTADNETSVLGEVARIVINDLGQLSAETAAEEVLHEVARLTEANTNELKDYFEIKMELAKFYLCKSITSSGSSVLVPEQVYLASLLFASGEFQTALHHCCLTNTAELQNAQCVVVDGALLPRMDANTSSALGLVTFYQHISGTSLNHGLDGDLRGNQCVFSAKLLALYLQMKCAQKLFGDHSAHICDATARYLMAVMTSSNTCITIADVILLRQARYSCTILPRFLRTELSDPPSSATKLPTEFEHGRLRQVISDASVQHYARFHQFLLRKYGTAYGLALSARFDVSNINMMWQMRDAAALCSAKQYTKCIEACEHVLLQTGLISFDLYHNMTNLIFFGDLASLTGLITVVSKSRFKPRLQCVSCALYLAISSHMELRRSTNSLSRYLKLMCYRADIKQAFTSNTFDTLVLAFIYRKAIVYRKRLQ